MLSRLTFKGITSSVCAVATILAAYYAFMTYQIAADEHRRVEAQDCGLYDRVQLFHAIKVEQDPMRKAKLAFEIADRQIRDEQRYGEKAKLLWEKARAIVDAEPKLLSWDL